MGHLYWEYLEEMSELVVKKLLFFLFFLFVMSLLLVRLFDVQLVKGSYFSELADDNRFYSLPIEAYRGVFLDRYGDPLVWNTKEYFFVAAPEKLYPEKVPITREKALEIMASNSAQVVTEYGRTYRYGESMAHVLGYVGQVTAEDLEKNADLPLSRQIGKSGLEAVYDQVIRGADGEATYEINAMGKRQRLISSVHQVDGQNIETSLDPYLTQVAYDSLGDAQGVVVISDTKTGEVLSMVSKPSFDPNIVSKKEYDSQKEVLRRQAVSRWFQDEGRPFFNRVTAGMFPPGSVFKIVTALAGLENGKVDRSTTVIDEGVLKVGEYEYRSWYFWSYGRVDGEIGIVRAITRSNDIFFYKVAEWVGPDKLAEMARLLGFGEVTEIELGGQAKGIVPDPAWKEKVIGERWYLGNTYHYGIGQGDILVTPLQITQMVQAIANNGTMCPPRIVPNSKADKCYELGLREENITVVLEGMMGACSPGGTAFPFFDHNSRILGEGEWDLQSVRVAGAVACKTGTAEFGSSDERGYRKTHGWWVGVINLGTILANREAASQEAESVTDKKMKQLAEEWHQKIKESGFPEEIVITVLVESDDQHPYREGSGDAAPVGKAILDWIM